VASPGKEVESIAIAIKVGSDPLGALSVALS
jgi:hypothetical protein